MDTVGIAVRWAHIGSVAVLVGAAVYVWAAKSTMAASFRSAIYTAMALLVGSGLYQFLTRESFPKGYHMWFGIKMLLVLHIFTLYLLIALGRGDEGKQKRWVASIAFAGLVTILLAGILRSLGS